MFPLKNKIRTLSDPFTLMLQCILSHLLKWLCSDLWSPGCVWKNSVQHGLAWAVLAWDCVLLPTRQQSPCGKAAVYWKDWRLLFSLVATASFVLSWSHQGAAGRLGESCLVLWSTHLFRHRCLPDLFYIDDKWACIISFLLPADNGNTISFTGLVSDVSVSVSVYRWCGLWGRTDVGLRAEYICNSSRIWLTTEIQFSWRSLRIF